MAAAVSFRSEGEVAGQLALSEDARRQSAYRATIADAVTRSLRWAAGDSAAATPLAGESVRPTPSAITTEMHRAVALERAAIARGEPSAWLGKVGHTLSWFLCEDGTEPPLL